MPNNNGPILAKPELVLVTYSDYAFTPQLTAWGSWVETSDWLTQVGADYGVSTSSVPVRTAILDGGPSPATITDGDVQNTILAAVNNGVLPPPDSNTLYMMLFPSSTSVSNQIGALSCVAFGGYHSAFTPSGGGSLIPYAIINDCAPGTGNSEILNLEITASHELIEAATDVDVLGTTAWKITDPTSAWFALDGEVGDQCEYLASYYLDPTGTYAAQRIWSNTAALNSAAPCIPLPPAAADVSPFFAESVTSDLLAPLLSPGGSGTYTLQAWSKAAAPSWTAYVRQVSGTVTVEISQTSLVVKNGDTQTFTVTVPSSASFGQYAVLIVTQYPSSGTGDTMFWPIEIGVGF